MSKATKFRKIRDGMTAAVAALGATSLIAGFMVLGTAGAAQANGQGSQQVWVCKYIGQPGNERLRTQNNPMQEAAPSSTSDGGWFKNDEQSSYVIGPVTLENTIAGPPASYINGTDDCPASPPPVDVCPNIDDDQAEVPAGYEVVEGDCVEKQDPPVDVCDNIDGDQAEMPDGFELVEGDCVEKQDPPVDVCDNIDGVQASVPDGYELVDGDCVKKQIPSPPPVSPPVVTPPVVTPPVVTPPTTDVCSNIPGKQGSVPLGYTAVDGICTKDDVAGEETEAPKPTQPTKTDKPKAQKPGAGEVLGEEAVPTAVAAGIGGPTGSIGSPSSLLGQGLVAGGLMMLLLAGSAQMGRRQHGAHEH